MEIKASETSQATLRLGPKAAQLTVRVLDSETGDALDGVTVWLTRVNDPDAQMYLSAKELEILVPSDIPIRIAVTREGYRDWVYTDADGNERLILPPDSERTITARLEK